MGNCLRSQSVDPNTNLSRTTPPPSTPGTTHSQISTNFLFFSFSLCLLGLMIFKCFVLFLVYFFVDMVVWVLRFSFNFFLYPSWIKFIRVNKEILRVESTSKTKTRKRFKTFFVIKNLGKNI